MGVLIKNRTYKNPFNSSTTNFLCGNVGTFLRLEFDVEVSVRFETTMTESIVTESSNKIKLVSGKKWKDLGFDTGMAILVQALQYVGATPSVLTYNVNITAIYNDTLFHSGTIDFTNYTIVPGTDNIDYTKKITKVGIVSNTILDACNFKYQLIKNSEVGSNLLTSLIDGTETEFLATGLSSLAINGVIPFTPIGYQSGMAITNASIKYISNVSGVRTYQFSIDFLLTGIYDNLSDLEVLQKPDYLNGTESMSDNILIKFFPQINNPNVFIQNDMNYTQQLGNVGWLNENYNGLNDSFVVSNVQYSIPSGVVSSLIYNQETTIQATISGLSNPSDPNLKLTYGILWATKDDTKFKSKNSNHLKNLKMNINGSSGFSSSVISVNAGNDTTLKQGYSFDAGRIDVTAVDFVVSGSNVVMTLKVVCTQDFQDYLEVNPDDSNYLIWVAIGDQNLNVNESNRVSKVIDINSFDEYVQPAGQYPYLDTIYYRHPHTTNVMGTCDLGIVFIEDDILARHRFAVNQNDYFLLEKVTFKIEAIRNDGFTYELDEFGVNVSSYPIVSNIQEINYSVNRGFKYGPNNEKNLVRIFRDNAIDDSEYKYYLIDFGFKVRWEDWIERLNVPTDFYNTSKGKNGFNNNWYDYDSVQNWNVFYSIYLKGMKNNKEIEYRNVERFIPFNYESNPNIKKTIKYYRDSDNTQLIGGYEQSGKEIGILLENEYTRIEVEYELITGVFPNDEYGTICIQVENGAGQMKFRQISTLFVSESDCPLIPLQGDTMMYITYIAPNKCVLKCLVDSSLLDDAVNYRITSRLGCKQIIEAQDFIYTTGVNVSNTNNVNLKHT